MSLLSAIAKSGFRAVNNKFAQSNKQKAKTTAYNKVGKSIKIAKRQNRYVNGSKLYKEQYSKELRTITKTHTFFDKLISDF